MINKIAFTGRETMLTKGIKTAESAADKLHEYLGAGKVYTQKEINAAEKQAEKQVEKQVAKISSTEEAKYTSPFAPAGSAVTNVQQDIRSLDFIA